MPPIDPHQPGTLTKELVQHLSKEIETTTNNMMAFRTRIGFSLCIGPFLLLGSLIVGAKGQPVTRLSWYYVVPALVVIAVCYLGIAYITSEIELQGLEQCNKWRNLIREICKSPSIEIKKTELIPTLEWRGFSIFGAKWKPNWYGVTVAYRVGYLLLFIAVIAAVFIVSVGTPEPANYSRQVAPTATPSRQISESKDKSLPKE